MPEQPEVLDAAGAARLLGVDVNELVGLAARGDLRPVPHSWPLRIRRSELEAFLARRLRWTSISGSGCCGSSSRR